MMEAIQVKFTLKNFKIEPPEDYLGAVLEKMTTANGTECWTQSSDKYVRASVENLEAFLANKGSKIPSNCLTPFSSNYRRECDVSTELGTEGHRFFQ